MIFYCIELSESRYILKRRDDWSECEVYGFFRTEVTERFFAFNEFDSDNAAGQSARRTGACGQ
jgi:hypothetical protein